MTIRFTVEFDLETSDWAVTLEGDREARRIVAERLPHMFATMLRDQVTPAEGAHVLASPALMAS